MKIPATNGRRHLTHSGTDGRPPPPLTTGPGAVLLTATGAGTAMASVSAIALYNIEGLVGGVWSVAAVVVAGIVCMWLASVFAHLAAVIPSGASMIAYAIRGLGSRLGMLLILPYFMAMLFLAGFEAIVVGELAAYVLPLPPLIGAGLFLVGTWSICRSGMRVGYRTQAVATAALFLLLVSVSITQMFRAAELGVLHERLLPMAPDPLTFLAAVGQALFLFMGFELITAHAEVAQSRAVRPALRSSVVVLILFYAALALGFSSMSAPPHNFDTFLVPQLAVASQVTVPSVVLGIALVCILASFTSYNGALLGLSRFTYSLAKQRLPHHRLATLDPRTLTARPALTALLVTTMALAAIVYAVDLYLPSIFAAAITAALVYATMAFLRERKPFLDHGRGWLSRTTGAMIALVLIGLAVGVLMDADGIRKSVVLVLAVFFSAAAWIVRKMQTRRPVKQPGQDSPVLTRRRWMADPSGRS